jgi:hypothetical protein
MGSRLVVVRVGEILLQEYRHPAFGSILGIPHPVAGSA